MSIIADFFKGLSAVVKGFRVTFRQMGLERVTMESRRSSASSHSASMAATSVCHCERCFLCRLKRFLIEKLNRLVCC